MIPSLTQMKKIALRFHVPLGSNWLLLLQQIDLHDSQVPNSWKSGGNYRSSWKQLEISWCSLFFYGNANDGETWKGWRLHLEPKFCQSPVIYTCEQDKIVYIRGHCTDTTSKVIKTKANPTSANAYLSASDGEYICVTIHTSSSVGPSGWSALVMELQITSQLDGPQG